MVRLLGQRRLRHHLLALVRGRQGQEEEQEEAQERAAAHEPAQQRGGQKGNCEALCVRVYLDGGFMGVQFVNHMAVATRYTAVDSNSLVQACEIGSYLLISYGQMACEA